MPDYIRGGFTGNNSVTPNYPLSHLTPSFDDFAVEIAAKGNKSSSIHFSKSGAVQCAKGEINLTKMFSPQEAKLSAQKFLSEVTAAGAPPPLHTATAASRRRRAPLPDVHSEAPFFRQIFFHSMQTYCIKEASELATTSLAT